MNMIKMLCVPLTVFALSAGAALAESKGHGDKGHGKRPKVHHAQQFCPPGLAKKSPACLPPGQAKKHLQDRNDDDDNVMRAPLHAYRVGDFVRDDCVIVSRYRYQSLPAGTYCRYENRLMRIDPQSRAILTILQVLANN